MYFQQEQVEGFGNAFGEAYSGFWELEIPYVVPQQFHFRYLSTFRFTRPLQSNAGGFSLQLRQSRFPRGKLR